MRVRVFSFIASRSHSAARPRRRKTTPPRGTMPRSRRTAGARLTCATASSRTRRAATARRCGFRSRSRTPTASRPMPSTCRSCASARGASPTRARASPRCSSSLTCASLRSGSRKSSLRHALLDLDEGRFASKPRNGCRVQLNTAPSAARSRRRSTIRARSSRCRPAGSTKPPPRRARAHDAARAAGDPAEQANALRLLGIAALQGGDAAKARAQLEEALALDRELGAPRKIALDLLALGRAAALAGERDAARAYYARALAVSEADRDSDRRGASARMLDAATGK